MYIEMKITRGKHIYKPSGLNHWGISHAQVPFAIKIEIGKIRVFFSTRDEKSRSGVTFIDVDEKNPENVLYIHDKLCLSHGSSGTFDDSGTMPSWFIKEDNRILLYYTPCTLR
eukprot:Opistho-1_new@27722